MGDELVVGLIPDDEIVRCKGCQSVLNEDERKVMVDSIKWVDEVITGWLGNRGSSLRMALNHLLKKACVSVSLSPTKRLTALHLFLLQI